MPMSLENRKKAGERLKAAREAKRKVPVIIENHGIAEAERGGDFMPGDRNYPSRMTVAERAEVHRLAGLKTNDERLAKARMMQAKMIARDPKAQEAIARHEAENSPIESERAIVESTPQIPEPPKSVVVQEVPFKAPFRLTGSQSGMMISEFGPCVCGEQKLKWHAICLKVRVSG